MDHLWYFVSRGEQDGPSGHVVVCPAHCRAVKMQTTVMFTLDRSG